MTAKLRELQHLLVDALRSETPIASRDDLRETASGIARGSERLSPAEQLDVYREQFFLRHVACLEEDFPVLVAVLGGGGFERLACDYLARHPPTSFSLRDLGAGLPSFVAARDGLEHRSVLADAAALDWAFVDAFDAATAPTLDLEKLRDVGGEIDRAALVVCPSVRLVEARYPVHELRRAVLDDEAPPVMVRAPTFLLVHRPQLDVTCRSVPRLAFRTLELLRDGLPLGEALDRIASELDGDATAALERDIGGWFGGWAEMGILRDLVLPAGSVLDGKRCARGRSRVGLQKRWAR